MKTKVRQSFFFSPIKVTIEAFKRFQSDIIAHEVKHSPSTKHQMTEYLLGRTEAALEASPMPQSM